MSSTPTLIINLSNLVSSAHIYHGYEAKRSAYMFCSHDSQMAEVLGTLHVKPRPQFQALTQPHIQWQFTIESKCMGFGMLYYHAEVFPDQPHLDPSDKFLEIKPTNASNYSALQYWLDAHDKSIIFSHRNRAGDDEPQAAKLTLPTDPS